MLECREVTAWSDAFVDGELHVAMHARILHHLRKCNGCAGFIEGKRRLKRLVHVSVTSVTPPASLRFRLLTGIGA